MTFFHSKAQGRSQDYHNVLYLNSYALSYSWSDSLTVGILEVFKARENIMFFTESLDAKRFGQSNFDKQYKIFKEKYKNTSFEVIVASDNDALDFLFEYGDLLFKGVPVVFCGVANVNDYSFDERKYYGIQEWVETDSVVNLILKVMPEVESIYYFSDSTTTSLINWNKAKQMEPYYADKVDFKFITALDIDSLIDFVSKIGKNNAIALVDIYSNIDKTPINTDVLVQDMAAVSKAPLFIGSETTLGKGIMGGIIISGSNHGRAASELALKFIDNPDFVPKQRVLTAGERAMFDYNILKKFHVNLELIPEDAVVINAPQSVWYTYRKYILLIGAAFLILLLVIVVLSININMRKRAELLLARKLSEIEEKNLQLELFNDNIKEMNVALEVANEKLQETNGELGIALNKAEESEGLKTAFLANISHEIRTPMNAIIGFSDLLVDPLIDNVTRDGFIQNVKSESYQLLHIIEGIVELSKIEAKQIAISEIDGDIENLFSDVYKQMKAKIPEGKDLIFYEGNVELVANTMIKADFYKLHHILVNLISNAFKYSTAGDICFGCSLKDKGVLEFFVKDEGIGIAEEHHEMIFENFRQVDSAKSVFQSGSGIGLSIAKSYVELMYGKIWVESMPEKGTVVYFSIPYKPRIDIA